MVGSMIWRESDSMPIDGTKKVIVPPDVLCNVIDGESVLLNLKSECYFGLDEVGTRMWQVLSSSESIAAACESLLAEYEVDRERLCQDVDELVGKLAKQGLVELVDVA